MVYRERWEKDKLDSPVYATFAMYYKLYRYLPTISQISYIRTFIFCRYKYSIILLLTYISKAYKSLYSLGIGIHNASKLYYKNFKL